MWIFPIVQSGEASQWRVCYQRGLPRLVSHLSDHLDQAAHLKFVEFVLPFFSPCFAQI